MKEDKTVLTDTQIETELQSLPGWRREGIYLKKDFILGNFGAINRFLPHLTRAIVAHNHHPDFSFVGGDRRVSVSMTTHTEQAITQADIDLARALEGWRDGD